MRFYKGFISSLSPSQVFVFGSNRNGFHGAGTAGVAFKGSSNNDWRDLPNFRKAMNSPIGHPDRVGRWAIYGISRGFMIGTEGKSYAIVTVSAPGRKRSIPLEEIYSQFVELDSFCKSNPELEFISTVVGGGYSGYTKSEIEELYLRWDKELGLPENISLPAQMKNIILQKDGLSKIDGKPSNPTSGRLKEPGSTKYYAGIGSRQTPPDSIKAMKWIGWFLNKYGYTLRSGGAPGADKAFEENASKKEIFRSDNVPKWAFEMVQKYLSPGRNWNHFKPFTKTLLARDMMQILGADGESPVEFVVCWTPDGKDSGGTGYAIRCAKDWGIPVYNLFNEEDRVSLKNIIEEIKKKGK